MKRKTAREDALRAYANLFDGIHGRGVRLSAVACRAQASDWGAVAAEHAAALLQGDPTQEILFWRAKIASERWAKEARRAEAREDF